MLDPSIGQANLKSSTCLGVGDDFHTLGREFRSLNRKTVIVQEGGYLVENLGRNVESFLSAFL